MSYYYREPKMSLAEWRGRIEPFTNEPWADTPNGTGFREAAIELLDRTRDRWKSNPNYLIDSEWWNNEIIRGEGDLSLAACRLGAWILYGSTHADPNWLTVDMSDMPLVYQRPFRAFIEEMIEVMVSGIDKGYTMLDNLENGIEWQVAEGKMKFKEFLHMYRDGQRDRAAKLIIKPATAAMVTWMAFCYYQNPDGEPDWDDIIAPLKSERQKQFEREPDWEAYERIVHPPEEEEDRGRTEWC